MKYWCVCIDIFTKYAWVVPIPSRLGPDMAFGIIECLKKMKNNSLKDPPKTIYADGEPSMNLRVLHRQRHQTRRNEKPRGIRGTLHPNL